MKIRAITIGTTFDLLGECLNKNLGRILKEEFEKEGIEVQTIRLCTQPFDITSELTENEYFKNRNDILSTLDKACDDGILNYYSYCPGMCDQIEPLTPTQKKIIHELPDMLQNHRNMFSSIQVSSKRGMNFEAISECAKIIKKLSSPDPFLNLQFAATFNVPANTPFFPSAYHLGKKTKISIALEAADEILSIMKNFKSGNKKLNWLRTTIQNRFTEIYDKIKSIITPYCEKLDFIFEGVDFSPAQYPTEEKSIGTAVEAFGMGDFGELGTVFGIGFLTSALKEIKRPKIGFSGFMQPLLEDFTIAKRNSEGKVSITQLMLNSTICGLGLDCIPLPGDVDENTLTLLMMDLAMISSRLNKPLTARLMPIPGKSTGEHTEFDFEYFANSKICDINSNAFAKVKEFIKNNPGFLL